MTRRGSILLEVLLATAVFAFAGVVVLGAVDGSVTDGARAARRSLAMDLARSTLARMEAGIPDEADQSFAVPGLRVESRMEPSDFPGLALAVVEVYDEARDGRAATANDDPRPRRRPKAPSQHATRPHASLTKSTGHSPPDGTPTSPATARRYPDLPHRVPGQRTPRLPPARTAPKPQTRSPPDEAASPAHTPPPCAGRQTHRQRLRRNYQQHDQRP